MDQRALLSGGLGKPLLVLGSTAAVVTAALLGLSAYMAHVITQPRRLRVLASHEVRPGVEDISFRTDDGLTLHGWYLAPASPGDAIVVGHGFGMNRAELLALAQGLRERGHAVLLFDFRAHGVSEGLRSTLGYYEAGDFAAAVRFLRARPDLAGCAIGVVGISMGAAAAIMAAAREPAIAAVVADSAFATLRDIAAGGLRLLYKLPAFPFAPLIIRFGEVLTHARIRVVRPIDAVAAIAPRPLLIIHGASDRLIPAADARALYAAAGEPKAIWIVPELGHAAAFCQRTEEYLDRLDHFFSTALTSPALPLPAGRQ